MRKRLLSILLSVLLCLALVSPQAAAADIYFVAVDDSVPLTLPSSMSPFFSGSTLYVPSSVFEAAPGGVTPSYNASGQTLVLFRSGARLIFNLANGTVTDEDKNSSNISTVSKNGTIYLPLYFCTSHFGLSVTTLNSAEGYPILRFTTGSEVYDDAMFVEKAENLITYLAEQYGSGTPSVPNTNGGEEDPPGEEEPHVSGSFCLAIEDAASMEASAAALESAGQRAAFFLTGDEIEAFPELVRSLYAAGHTIGLTVPDGCEDPAAELGSANEALFRVLRRKTLCALLTAAQTEDCIGYAIFIRPEEQPPLEELLTDGAETHLLVCTDDTAEVLSQLDRAGATLRPLRETSPLAHSIVPQEPPENDGLQ